MIALTRSQLAAYSAMSVPLAMAALPIYVHVPKLYAGELGMPLALIGAILLAARLLDALQDPLLGYLSDRCAHFPLGRSLPIVLGLPLLGAGFVGLFHPPQANQMGQAIWLMVNLLIVYMGFSAACISYFAMGAEMSTDHHQRTRVTATRSAFGLLGVLIAAAAPGFLGGDIGSGLAIFSLAFLPVLIVAAFVTLRGTVRPVIPSMSNAPLRSMLLPLRNMKFRWLMGVYIFSGIAGAIPGTLILFYVEDIVRRPDLAGVFLALYFLCGALGMPLWIAASRRLGKKYAWIGAMFLAVLAFVWAYVLKAGDVVAFGVVCAVSGIAYGAELAIPPSMLADVVDEEAGRERHRPDGVYFGLWQTIEKFNLAAAAGIALPLLASVGYEPGTAQQQSGSLAAVYALLPSVIKLGAAALLWVAPVGHREGITRTSNKE
ncbi:MFS transporter, partial [Rhodoferax sp.]|uniref:MFS transporter n=1 Tax=Rhodoferax sp. TaxID=50421 RepID=UPI00374D90D5